MNIEAFGFVVDPSKINNGQNKKIFVFDKSGPFLFDLKTTAVY